MAGSRKKGSKAAAAAAAARRQWKIGDLVLAKVKGFPAWPATVSEPTKWGFQADWKKVLVYFFGTKQIAFCNPADVEEFTEEKKESLLGKRQGRSSDFIRAVQEIVDCYEKLKESNLADQLCSGETPAENTAGEDLNESKTAVLDAKNDSRLKLSDSARQKDEQSLAVEDVRASLEEESLSKRGASEELVDAVAPSLPLSYTLRKKSRNSQSQRSSSRKKISVLKSRSLLRSDSRGSQDGDPKCSDGKNSAEGGLNGFWDGPLRRAKRSRRSPDCSAPSIGGSPTCNSYETVEDNGSEVAMAESETLSNNEGSVIELNNKHEHSEVVNDGGCKGGLELSRRLDLQAKTAIVRKKRNTGRRRALHDALESASRPDQEVNMETVVSKESALLPPTSGRNVIDIHPKSEGDEHLPLVKRARVRMGKLLSEELQQPDFIVKSEKPVECHPTSVSREAITSVNCGNIISLRNSLNANDSTAYSPEVGSADALDNELPEKTCTFVVNDPLEWLGFDAWALDNKPQPWKAKTCQTSGCEFDGEAALPPSKRLHRALEAMSANAAEENKPFEAVAESEKTNNEAHLLFVKTCSNVLVENEAANNVELQNESVNCHSSSVDHTGVTNSSNMDVCEIITKSSGTLPMKESATRNLDRVKVESPQDTMDEVTVSSDDKNLNGSDNAVITDDVLSQQVLRTVSNSVDGSGTILQCMTTVQTRLSSEDFSKAGEEDGSKTVRENNEVTTAHTDRGTNPNSSGEEAVTVGYHDGASVDPGNRETDCLVSKLVLIAENDKQQDTSLCDAVRLRATNVIMESSLSPSSILSSGPQTCHDTSGSGGPVHDQVDAHISTRNFPTEIDKHKHASQTNGVTVAYIKSDNSWQNEFCAAAAKFPLKKHALSDESKSSDAVMNLQAKSGERINLAEVKAALASLELTLGSLTRTKESIGRATRIAVDCLKFGVATEVVELVTLYLEKESSLYKRVDLFFLVDSIAQCCRSLKDPGEVGCTYISAVKETLARMLSFAAPPGHSAKENRRQCLKVLRLWLERRILPDSIIRQHIRELESQNCSSTGGHSRRMSRTERSFDDPLRDMEGMLVDEYGSNSSFQLPGFCMPRMLKEEDDGSDSDGGSFEAVTPEHDSRNKETGEVTALPANEKHRRVLEDVDGELEMEDVAPSEVNMDPSATVTDNAVLKTHCSDGQFVSFVPPLPHDVPPRAPPLPTSPPPLPPPPPPPPPPPLLPHASTMSLISVDSQLHVGRNSVQEILLSRPPAPGIHHPVQMPEATSCSYNSYPVMPNPVAPGNNLQHSRPPYPSPSNQFSYYQGDQQIRPHREVLPPSYYDRPHFGPNVESGHFYGDQDSIRAPRHELTNGWGYSRPPFPAQGPGPVHPENDKTFPPMYPVPSCESARPRDHGWAFPPRPIHHQNHIPSRPPCDGPVPVAVRAPGYWRPR